MSEKNSLVLEVNGTCYRLDDDVRSEFKDFGSVRVQRTATGDFVVQGNRERLRVAGQTVASIVLEDGLAFTAGREKCRCFLWTAPMTETARPAAEASTEREQLEDRILIEVLKRLKPVSGTTGPGSF